MNFSGIADYWLAHPSSTQLALFALTMISMWLLEQAASNRPARDKWRHTMFNGLFVLSALPIQAVMMFVIAAVARWTEEARWGLVHLLPDAEAPWIRYGLMFVALDLLDYLYHFTVHQVPAFWRFHLVHHTDQGLDVSTTVREHPGETVIRNNFLLLWVLLTGASAEVLLLRQAIETVANILSHTAFRLPAGPARIVGWLFITPNLHHAHHHFRRPATNCNYGDVFSLWDRLFGTLIDLSPEDTVYGLDSHMGVGMTPAILPPNDAIQMGGALISEIKLYRYAPSLHTTR